MNINDLQHKLTEELAFLRRYEEELRYEDDPRRQQAMRREIEGTKTTIRGLQAQLAELGVDVDDPEDEEKPNNRIPSTLPPQPYFFGRQKELESIAQAISPEARTWGALIDGPGGIGKTALAVRAGHLAPADNFDRKIFLSAKIRELTPKGEQKLEDFMLPNYMDLLAELARELGDETLAQHAPNERANAVRRALADVRALIIIEAIADADEYFQ